jgi:hypothetical protein
MVEPARKRDETEMNQSLQKPVQRKKKALPDVTLVVGGVEFKEYSQQLCRWSEYFDAALESGMKETETKRFEFPDRDPKEWEWIAAVMAPLPKEKVTVEKLTVALSWFDELCCYEGLEECEHILFTEVLEGLTGQISTQALGIIIESLHTCVKYQLHRSKYKCFELVIAILDSKPWCACEIKLQSILSLVKCCHDCRKELLPTIQGFLPQSMSNGQKELLLQNDIMHHYVLIEIRCRLERSQGEKFVKHLEDYVIRGSEARMRLKVAVKVYKNGDNDC